MSIKKYIAESERATAFPVTGDVLEVIVREDFDDEIANFPCVTFMDWVNFKTIKLCRHKALISELFSLPSSLSKVTVLSDAAVTLKGKTRIIPTTGTNNNRMNTIPLPIAIPRYFLTNRTLSPYLK